MVVLLGWCGWVLPLHAAEPSSMDQLRAAYLYQFTKFVGWNETIQGDLVIALVGDDPLRGAEETIIGKRSQGREIRVVALHAGMDPENDRCCDVLYGSLADLAALRAERSEWFGKGVLVVSDGDREAAPAPDAARWRIIKLYTEDSKLRFDVDLDLATRSGLTLGSELLKNAGAVYLGGNAP